MRDLSKEEFEEITQNNCKKILNIISNNGTKPPLEFVIDLATTIGALTCALGALGGFPELIKGDKIKIAVGVQKCLNAIRVTLNEAEKQNNQNLY